MSAIKRRTRWDVIFSREFLSRPRCWETCGGGFCCNPARVQRYFGFLTRTGVDLPHLPGEYAFLLSAGKLQGGIADTYVRKEIRLGEGLSFPLYVARCTLHGLCSLPAFRPIVCRSYPFMPVPAVDGSLEKLEPTALIDLYWDRLSNTSQPCTIRSLTPAEEASFRLLSAELFRDPVNIFYLRAASLYKRLLRDGLLERYPALLEQTEEEFFKAWEKLLVMGGLIPRGQLTAVLLDLYKELKSHYGPDFSLEGL